MMTAVNRIEQVPLGSLMRYLTVSRWRRRTLPSGIVVFAMGPENDDIEIVLPATTNARDLHERLANAVTTLSALERRSFDEVIAEIRAIGYDLVLPSLPDSAIREDTITLGTAEQFIQHLKRILAASAHGELHVGPYFLRVDGNAKDFAENCRFGHTFRGSFGFTVESPVGPHTSELAVEEVSVPPLQRRAIRRLARGLRIIEAAIGGEDPSEIVKGYQSGLNANACDELADLLEMPQVGQVKFDIVFSPEWGFPPDLGRAPQANIHQAIGSRVIRDAAKALRVVHYDRMRTIVGMVRTLHSDENPSNLFEISGSQDIVVEWLSQEFGRKNIQISLGPEEYLEAVEAHKSGRQISVDGELEQDSRPWRLENPREFRLV
jgi:hypothetical protein